MSRDLALARDLGLGDGIDLISAVDAVVSLYAMVQEAENPSLGAPPTFDLAPENGGAVHVTQGVPAALSAYKTPKGAFITVCPCNIVSARQLLLFGEFRPGADSVPWPWEFNMEMGSDRRLLYHISDEAERHAIDWYRRGSSCDVLPNSSHLVGTGNPYDKSSGIASIAHDIYAVLKNDLAGEASLSALIERCVETQIIADQAVYHQFVEDVMRDCALFGMVLRCTVGSDMPYFVIRKY